MGNYIKKIILITLLFVSTSAFASIAKVVAFKGEATIIREGKNLSLTKQSTILKHDEIQTKNNTKVQLLFKDNTIISIGARSTFEVFDYLFDEKNKKYEAKFSMLKGTFRTITGKIGKLAPKKFNLKTKSASIGIRGTQIVMNITKDNEQIFCTEGRILVNKLNTNIYKEVKAGEFVSVQANTSNFNVKKIKPSDLKKINKSIAIENNLAKDNVTKQPVDQIQQTQQTQQVQQVQQDTISKTISESKELNIDTTKKITTQAKKIADEESSKADIEKEKKEKEEEEAKKAKEKAEKESKEKAETEAKAKLAKTKADEEKAKAEKADKEAKEAKEKADADNKAAADAKDKADADANAAANAKDKADADAKAAADAKDKADANAAAAVTAQEKADAKAAQDKANADNKAAADAKDKADAKAKAAADAKDKADAEAKATADAKDKAAADAKATADAKDKADAEAKAAKDAKDKAADEAKAAKDAKDKADADAKAAKDAKDKADADAKAAKDAKDKLNKEKEAELDDLSKITPESYFKKTNSTATYKGDFNNYEYDKKKQYMKKKGAKGGVIPTETSISMDINFGKSKDHISNGKIKNSDAEFTFDGHIHEKDSKFHIEPNGSTKGKKTDGYFYGKEANLIKGKVDMESSNKTKIKGSFDADKQ